ncbi:MAG TPA: YDG domain-containing protein [Mucilaginibacter sp.]|jgi:hypothetical protein
MKKYLPTSIIEQSYIPRPGRRFKSFSVKLIVIAVTFVLTTMSSAKVIAASPSLTGLTISIGTLSPAFASGTISYTVSESSSTSSVTVTPTASSGSTFTMTLNGTTVSASNPLTLNAGTNPISIAVTQGNTTVTYTITVTRENISYTGSPYNYLAGTTITPLTPINTGDTPTGYAVSPTLPAGLSCNTSTGVISGTPTTVTAAANYTITATYSTVGITATTIINITIAGQPQTIAFTLSSPQVYGTAPISLNGTASSGLTVSYSSSNTSVVSVSGSTLTIVGVGTATITASQAGSSTYAAATDVTQSITVTAKALTISGLTANDKTYDGTTTATLSGTGTLSGVVSGDVVSYNSTGTFATANVGTNITVTLTLTGAQAGNYTLTQPGITANITAAPLNVTATGPTKSYGTVLSTGTSSINFTATGAVTGETVTSVTLTADANGQSATAPVGATYVVTPSLATGTGGFLASNYNITYNIYAGTVTPAALTITAIGPSLADSAVFTNGIYTTYFVSTPTAVSGETVTSVTLTSSPTLDGTQPAGTPYTITPSAATGTGGFLASNYTITYVPYSDQLSNNSYTWTGASDNNWTNSANWTASRSPSSYPHTTNDDVNIGVTLYASTNSQPTLNATETISSLTFGPNGGNAVTLTVSPGYNLTVGSELTLNAGTGIINLANSGTVAVSGGLTNKTGETFNVNPSSTTSGTLTIGNSFNNIGTATFGYGTVTMDSTFVNSGIATFGAGAVNIVKTYINSGTTTFGSGAVTMSGSFTNSGTTTFGTGLVTFNAPGPSVTDISTLKANPVTFNNVLFTGTNAQYLLHTNHGNGGGGVFNVASTGVMTLSNGTRVGTTNVEFTLLSDANGSATIANIPLGCKITGKVNVQRYISAKRGYRLISSPVYLSAVNVNNVYSLNYVQNTSYITGTNALGGFDKVGNPTLYLYRENLAPLYTTFLNSGFRGINDLTQAPDYYLDIDGGPYDIPVGNGFLFFYRGDRYKALVGVETVPSYPATAADLTATGALNQGDIIVKEWYGPPEGNLGFTTVSNDVTAEGANLVGNPYPSSIDWDNFSNTNSSAAIYGQNVAPFSYQLVQGTGNYGVFDASTPGIAGTNGATNIIPSGEGFFVYATGTGAALTFTEAAKTNTQVTGAALFMSKTPLASNNTQYLRLQLKLDSVNSDETIMRFNGNTKTTYDPMEDARYKLGYGKVSLSSLSSDNIPLAINQLPLASKGDTIRLKVSVSVVGSYNLSLKNIEGIPQIYDIWLKDAFTKDSVNMRKDSAYSFTISTDTASYGSNRFRLILLQNPALAYKLLSFDAKKTSGREAEITWTTKNEQNYTYFTVERSTDHGKTYVVVGDMPSNGAGTYSLLDKDPPHAADQYRLKSEDFNGTISYSNVVTLIYGNPGNSLAGNISVYPNPASHLINLTINQNSNNNQFSDLPVTQTLSTVQTTTGTQSYNIKIISITGSVISNATSSQAIWQNDVSNLAPGTYFIEVVNNSDKSLVGKSAFVKL